MYVSLLIGYGAIRADANSVLPKRGMSCSVADKPLPQLFSVSVVQQHVYPCAVGALVRHRFGDSGLTGLNERQADFNNIATSC
jgi:hypothetical protein